MILAAAPSEVNADWAGIWMSLGWIDIALLCVLVLGASVGIRRGLAKTFPGFFQVITAQTVAIEYSKTTSEFLKSTLQAIPIEILNALAFSFFSVSMIVLVRFLFHFLAVVASVDFKPPFNNIGAAFLGAVQFVLFASLTAYFLALLPIPFFQETLSTKSISGPYLIELNQHVHDFLVKWFPDTWRAIK